MNYKERAIDFIARTSGSEVEIISVKDITPTRPAHKWNGVARGDHAVFDIEFFIVYSSEERFRYTDRVWVYPAGYSYETMDSPSMRGEGEGLP